MEHANSEWWTLDAGFAAVLYAFVTTAPLRFSWIWIVRQLDVWLGMGHELGQPFARNFALFRIPVVKGHSTNVSELAVEAEREGI
ncbi:unnamed protein product [Strongylus vulgaris]|uniref:Uncharacterized protein n=1 Tax=Strongylus vulgaris TaxID=40348 RepID=A0A3P7LP53_STRVU|nr:unnamed protein product [Strongylus vulgaris]